MGSKERTKLTFCSSLFTYDLCPVSIHLLVVQGSLVVRFCFAVVVVIGDNIVDVYLFYCCLLKFSYI